MTVCDLRVLLGELPDWCDNTEVRILVCGQVRALNQIVCVPANDVVPDERGVWLRYHLEAATRGNAELVFWQPHMLDSITQTATDCGG